MKALAAFAAILGLLLLTEPSAPSDAWAQEPADMTPALTLTLTDSTPRIVTADGPTTLTLTGTLANTGPVTVTDLVIRAQRGLPLGTEGEVRDALAGNGATDAGTPNFAPLAALLAPGASTPVALTVALRGPTTTSLALADPGLYELLVNVNGRPEGGLPARLAATRILLPVLALPAVPGYATVPAPPVGARTPFTLLYPISEVPRRLITVPGAPVVLSDDALARSFAPDGRLGGLVTALAQEAPPGSRVHGATCLAIDPDLVETASLMSQPAGYLVAGPDGATHPGTGSAAAGQWLAQLRAVAHGTCVIALPYADADLVALTRGGASDAAAHALTVGRQVLGDVLGTPVSTVAWPAGGLLDEATARVVDGSGASDTILAADGVTLHGDPAPVTPLAGVSLPAVMADPLLSRAAAGPARPNAVARPAPGAAAATDTPAGTDTPLSTQDTIGALAWRSASGEPVVLAPPHRWGADRTGAAALLAAADRLIAAGRLSPRPLPDVIAAPVGAAAATPDLPRGTPEIPAAAIATIATARSELTDLRSAVVPDSGVGITADQLVTPLENGLLRPASAARQATPGQAQDAALAALAAVGRVRGLVRVLQPSSSYSLGTSDAPLPLTVVNGLPVTVRVRVRLASTAGLQVATIADQQIPPLGRRQVSVNARVTRAGQFVVDAAVWTPAGGQLGAVSRVRVLSTAYGTITGWLTAIAGVILVALVARRIWRRARGTARPADRTGPPLPPVPPQQGRPVHRSSRRAADQGGSRASPAAAARSTPGPATSPGPRPRPQAVPDPSGAGPPPGVPTAPPSHWPFDRPTGPAATGRHPPVPVPAVDDLRAIPADQVTDPLPVPPREDR